VVANSTNKTWLSSNDLHDDVSSQASATPTSTPSTLDRVRGRKLDDSEVVVFSPIASDVPSVGDDVYEQSMELYSFYYMNYSSLHPDC